MHTAYIYILGSYISNLVDCARLTSTKEINNLVDSIVDKSINHIVSQNIYYHKKSIKLYQLIPDNEKLINIEEYLDNKQQVLYDIKK